MSDFNDFNIGDRRLINVLDGTDDNNGTTLSQVKIIPRVWVNGVRKSQVKEYLASAVVSSGTAIFYLTDDGTAEGNAIFTNIYKESASFWIDDPTVQYQFGEYTLAADKKTLTLTVNKLGTVLVGIIQFISAANGVTVYMQVKGD